LSSGITALTTYSFKTQLERIHEFELEKFEEEEPEKYSQYKN